MPDKGFKKAPYDGINWKALIAASRYTLDEIEKGVGISEFILLKYIIEPRVSRAIPKNFVAPLEKFLKDRIKELNPKDDLVRRVPPTYKKRFSIYGENKSADEIEGECEVEEIKSVVPDEDVKNKLWWLNQLKEKRASLKPAV